MPYSVTTPNNHTYWPHALITPTTHNFQPDISFTVLNFVQDLLTFSKRQNPTFMDSGFQNWRKALQRFDEHEKSEMHNEAAVKLAAKSSTTDVAAQLNTQHKTDQAFHREMLMKLLSCIKFLARQGLPLRGHVEDTESFF